MKIVTAFLKYDYGIKERGISLEKSSFFPAISKTVDEVYPFWLEEHGFENDPEGLQYALVEYVNNIRPDYVFFILIKDEITIKTFIELRKVTKLINWFCDDQWRYDDYSKNIAPYLDVVITVDKFCVNKYRELAVPKVVLSQWGLLNADTKDQKRYDYKYDISFIGSKNIVREWYARELKKDFDLQCFGAGWENGRVSNEEMLEIFRSSKININLSNSIPKDYRFYRFVLLKTFQDLLFNWNLKKKIKSIYFNLRIILFKKEKKNIEQMKARVFEIAGSGGFELSQYALELEDSFEIGKEIAIYSSLDELIRQCDYYLANDSIRENIAKSGALRAKSYTYEERMKKVFKDILDD